MHGEFKSGHYGIMVADVVIITVVFHNALVQMPITVQIAPIPRLFGFQFQDGHEGGIDWL